MPRDTLYPGGQDIARLVQAESLSGLASFPGQLAGIMRQARESSRRELEGERLEEHRQFLRDAQLRKEELEDRDRALWAETYSGSPYPRRSQRTRSGGYGGYDSYGGYQGPTAKATKATKAPKPEPGAFVYDPSGDPTRREVFRGYSSEQEANAVALARAKEQAQALAERERAGEAVRAALGLSPGSVITPQALQRADRRLMDLVGGGFGLVGREAPELTIEPAAAGELWGVGAPIEPAPGITEYALPGDESYEYAKSAKGEWLTRRAGSGKSWDEAINLTATGNTAAVEKLERLGRARAGEVGPAVAEAPAALPGIPGEVGGPALATPSDEVYLRELGLLEEGEGISDVSSIEEMLRNPAVRVGLDPTYSESPAQFSQTIRQTTWGEGLGDQEKAQLIQDYKNFYADRMSERGELIGAERGRQKRAHLAALQAETERKISTRVAMLRKQPDYRGDSEAQLRELAWASLQNDDDFKAMQSQIGDIRQTILQEAPDHRKRKLEEGKQERGFETQDMRVQARYDESVGGFVNEYRALLADVDVIPTDQDGTYKSAEQLRKEIGAAIGRLKDAGTVVSDETTKGLTEFHKRANRAQKDAEARREEKIPEREEGAGLGDLTRAERARAMGDLSSLEAAAYRKAAEGTEVPKLLRDQMLEAEKAMGLWGANTQTYKDARARLEGYKLEAAEYGFPPDFTVRDFLEVGQLEMYEELAGLLGYDTRAPRPKPGDAAAADAAAADAAAAEAAEAAAAEAAAAATAPGPGYERIVSEGREYWWNKATNDRVPVGG